MPEFTNKIGKKIWTEKQFWLYSGGIVLTFIIFAVISGLTSFYADDFYYATFFQDGPEAFWRLTVEHYLNMNGRALVHFFDELLLLGGTGLFAFVNPFMLLLFYWYAAKSVLSEAMKPKRAFFLFMAMAVTLFLNIAVARESLYWITGSMNYLFPSMMAAAAFYLHSKSLETGRIRFYRLAPCFLCGATTEQGGAAAVFLTFFLAVSEADLKRKEGRKGPCGWAFPVISLAGYLTVILAPGTFYRATYEGAFITERLAESYAALSSSLLGSNGVCPYLAALFGLIAILPLVDRTLPKFLIPSGAIGAVLSVFCIANRQTPYLPGLCLLIFAIVCVCAAICFLKTGVYRGVGCFILAAMATQGVLLAAPGTYLRTMLPTVLLLTVCIVMLAARILQMMPGRFWMPLCSVLVLILALFSVTPTLAGYGKNKIITARNEQSVEQYGQNGYAEISTDIQYPYGFTMFYEEGYFTKYFYRYYRLPENPVIYYSSAGCPQIYFGDQRLTHPAVYSNGKRYLPLAPVINAAGGNLFWNGDVLTVKLGDKTVEGYKNDWISVSGGERQFLEGRSVKRFGKIYWEEELFSDIFGVVCYKEGENRLYVEMR